jgi:hypothetical protein
VVAFLNRILNVIDNISVPLADVLRTLLAEQSSRQLDIATASFSVSGWCATSASARKNRIL